MSKHIDTFKTNINRQAVDSLRGYVYQIHQSVFAALHLKDDEVLVLEGAEDFDIHNGNLVTTTQVRNKSSNISLNSQEIKEAIKNYWECKQNNSNKIVLYRYLTTSNVTFERTKPFGTKKGIDYWNDTSCEVSPLVDYLISLDLGPALTKYLKTETKEVIKKELINSIRWETGSQSIEAIQNSITDKIIHYGGKFGLDSHASSTALPNIFEYIANKSTSRDFRAVSSLDVQKCFEDATLVKVPRQTMVSRLSNFGHNVEEPSQEIAPVLSGPPHLLIEGAISRKKVVEKFEEIICAEQILFICGSNGLGKTSLAYLLSEKLDGNWQWINCRGINSHNVKDYLLRASYEINERNLTPFLVLDDLDFNNMKVYENQLLSLVFTTLNLNGKIIITSNGQPPLNIFPKIWRNQQCNITAPEFDFEEIQETIKINGLQQLDDLQHWVKTVYLQTLGHPQLVHAICRNLNAQNWPKDKIYDLEEPEDFERIKEEARNRLINDFPDENTRNLAYRLSLLNGKFNRETAFIVAENPPPIPLAGESLDFLVGPWIERENNGEYRVSQLLKGAAELIFTQDELNTLHNQVASSILKKGKINQIDLGTVLFHAFQAQNESILLSLSSKLISQDSESLKYLYEFISWFSLINLENSKPILPNSNNVNTEFVLRLAQFKLLSNSPNTQYIGKVVIKIEDCIDSTEDKLEKAMMENMAYSIILHTINIHIDSKKAIFMLSRLIDISDELPAIKELHFTLEREFENLPRFGGENLFQALFSFQASKFNQIDDLEELFEALELLPERKRNILIGVLRSDEGFCDHFLSSAWLCEDKKDSFNYDKANSVFRFVEMKAREWDLNLLIQSCLMTLSVIYDEYANSHDRALALIDEALHEFPNTAKLINQKAKVMLHMNKTLDAKPFVDQALTHPEISTIDYMFCCRLAGKSFAVIGDWKQAAYYFKSGAERSNTFIKLKKMGVGLLVDAAFCLWKIDEFSLSLLALADALDQLELIQLDDDRKTHHLHATVRHCVTWMHMTSLGRVPSNMSEPLPGVCSNQNPHKKIQTHKIIGGLENMWSFLELTESILELDLGIKKRATVYTGGKSVLLFDNYTSGLKYELMFTQMDFENSLTKILNYYRAYNYQMSSPSDDEKYKLGETPPLPINYWDDKNNCQALCTNFLKICLIQIVEKKSITKLVQNWIEDLKNENIFSPLINDCLKVLQGNSPSLDLHQQVAWSLLRLSISNQVIDAKELWFVSFRLLNLFSSNRLFIEAPFESALITKWLHVSQHCKEFSNHDSIVLKIKEICLSQLKNGFQKVAFILNLSSNILGMNLENNVEEYLQDIIDSE